MKKIRFPFKRKLASEIDFTINDLPHTRPQVFKTLFKNRFGFILKIVLLTLLFCLPVFFWSYFMRFQAREAQLTFSGEEQYQALTQTFVFAVIRCGINIPLFAIAGLGFGGAIHVFQKLVWNEMVFVSDFFAGIKANFLKYLVFGMIFGISYFVFELAFFGVPLSSLEWVGRAFAYGLSIVQLLIVTAMVAYMYLQNEYYTLKVKHLISNAFKLSIGSLVPSLGYLLIIFLPIFILLFDNSIIDLIAYLSFIFVIGPGLISLILYINFRLDKCINTEQFPSIVDKGVYRK